MSQTLAERVRIAWEPQVWARFEMTWDEFGEYVRDSNGELPPPSPQFATDDLRGLPGCWPHFFCTHG